MPRFALLLIFALVVPVFAIQRPRRSRAQRNQTPVIQSFTASSSKIALCPIASGGACYGTGTSVKLQVNASDPEDDSLSYRYSVTKGIVAANGPQANWELAKTIGLQTATVEVTDSRGAKVLATVQVDVEVCGSCDPPMPYMSVTCPTSVAEGEIARFESNVSPIDADQKLVYLWSHSNGERLPAQQGPTLLVKAVGRPGQVIKGTLEILGLDPASNRQASCSTTITKKP